MSHFLSWIAISSSKFHDWKARFGKVNEHNALVPRDHWLTDDEIEKICQYTRQHPLEGYRRLAFMMIDDDVVACSPSSVYRVLKKNNLLAGETPSITKKGTGFVQPLKPHEHWHVDVSYLNIAGTFYFLCSVLGPNGVGATGLDARTDKVGGWCACCSLGWPTKWWAIFPFGWNRVRRSVVPERRAFQ